MFRNYPSNMRPSVSSSIQTWKIFQVFMVLWVWHSCESLFRGITRLYTYSLIIISIACTTDGTKLLVKSICETVLKFLFWVPTCEPGFDYDWPVKKPLSKANITVKRNSKCISSNLLSLLVAQNKDIGTVSQMLLTEVRLPLPH